MTLMCPWQHVTLSTWSYDAFGSACNYGIYQLTCGKYDQDVL